MALAPNEQALLTKGDAAKVFLLALASVFGFMLGVRYEFRFGVPEAPVPVAQEIPVCQTQVDFKSCSDIFIPQCAVVLENSKQAAKKTQEKKTEGWSL